MNTDQTPTSPQTEGMQRVTVTLMPSTDSANQLYQSYKRDAQSYIREVLRLKKYTGRDGYQNTRAFVAAIHNWLPRVNIMAQFVPSRVTFDDFRQFFSDTTTLIQELGDPFLTLIVVGLNEKLQDGKSSEDFDEFRVLIDQASARFADMGNLLNKLGDYEAEEEANEEE